MLNILTGNMLGDGSISLSKMSRGDGKYSMTMDVYSLNYLHHLDQSIYSKFTCWLRHAAPRTQNFMLASHPNILLSPWPAVPANLAAS